MTNKVTETHATRGKTSSPKTGKENLFAAPLKVQKSKVFHAENIYQSEGGYL